MNYKVTNNDQDYDPYFDNDSFDTNLLKYYISNKYFSINPQWNKIIQSQYFKIYDNISNPCDLFKTDFPDYLAYRFNEYFQKKSKSNYFSIFFSRSENSFELDSICEAAAFLTETSQLLPQILLSDQFISQLIYITENYCGFPALMSLKTLSNIAENSFESSELLLSKELLQKASELVTSSSDRQIKNQSMFLISSFAKFDHGEDIANKIFTFFFESPKITTDLLNISLRAFSFLSHHHNQIFNQEVLIQKIYEFVQVKHDIVNSQCFSIFINLIHLDSKVIDNLFQLGIFKHIYDILCNKFSSYCIDFIEVTLVETRNYDAVIFNQEFIALYENFIEKEKYDYKFQILNLVAISLLNSSTDILSCIYQSSIFNAVFEHMSSIDIDQPFSKIILNGAGRFFTLIEDESDYFNELKQEFCETLQQIEFTDDEEINCLINQFIKTDD